MQTGSPALAALSGNNVSSEKIWWGYMLSAVQSGFNRSTVAAASAASLRFSKLRGAHGDIGGLIGRFTNLLHGRIGFVEPTRAQNRCR